ncbi:hypothetical protein PZB75_31070 (plasmid) [Streptomyces sp. AM 4-1-1]|uniref:hypothetical protein n=1 Tax=Streptomyces sp. AM 4-1-1 TaxID=3028710 RepID=UPI0023B95037|nr:hypothetical protein [Streptomyces sp. AM 4-1-1]WEH37846.1 hypothetical protein PZB75_31070 [Streptomyces sp. AM 4-1-1]
MTTIHERSRTWQGEGGPAEWSRAWDRTRDLIGTRADYFSEHDSDRSQEDGICALATALYITARERRIEPGAVPRSAVDDLIHRRPGESDLGIVRRWEAHIENLGHTVDTQNDPVSACWKRLRCEYDRDGWLWDDSLARHGYALTAIHYVLSPYVALTF